MSSDSKYIVSAKESMCCNHVNRRCPNISALWPYYHSNRKCLRALELFFRGAYTYTVYTNCSPLETIILCLLLFAYSPSVRVHVYRTHLYIVRIIRLPTTALVTAMSGEITINITCAKIGPNWDRSWSNLPSPFSKRVGMDRNLRVWPVGAVSNTTTEKWSSFTRLGGRLNM